MPTPGGLLPPDARAPPPNKKRSRREAERHRGSMIISCGGETAGQKLFDTGNLHQTSMYTVAGTATNTGTTISLSLSVNQGLTTTDFNVYGDPSTNKESISTIISIVGHQSGLRADLKITIRDET